MLLRKIFFGISLLLFVIIMYIKLLYIPNNITYINSIYKKIPSEYLVYDDKVYNILHNMSRIDNTGYYTQYMNTNNHEIPYTILSTLVTDLMYYKYKYMYKESPEESKILWKIRNILFFKSLISLDEKKIVALYFFNYNLGVEESSSISLNGLSIDLYKKNLSNLTDIEMRNLIILFMSKGNRESMVYKRNLIWFNR